jgi:hypothetical protein
MALMLWLDGMMMMIMMMFALGVRLHQLTCLSSYSYCAT